MPERKGLFIVLEGCEGCGKSTQARLLYDELLRRNIPAVLTHEPGGTPLGDSVRQILKVKRNYDISPQAELLLFNACRAQLVRDVILPALVKNICVICDRFTGSTLAYQGYGRGLGVEAVASINNAATGGLQPDLIFLLDLQPHAGLKRKHNPGDDRFEAEDIAFHHRVRDGYLDLAAHDPSRWIILEAQQPSAELGKAIFNRVLPFLNSIIS
ncbi:MAG: dTMP kinase [Dehalococcoidia bacterium]|nr:dTMP kinase [Dehalococcoidia bacterium]